MNFNGKNLNILIFYEKYDEKQHHFPIVVIKKLEMFTS